MIKRSHWHPPSVCGCKFEIVADWVNDDGYRHPTPFTIQEIKLVNVCARHKQYALSMPDTSCFFDDISLTNPVVAFLSSKNPNIAHPAMIQNRGYLKYPIANPTPAECLYTYFTKHKGQVWGLPCGCSTFQWIDDKGNLEHIVHPVHHKRCHFHKEDTLDMTQAHTDYKTYNQ